MKGVRHEDKINQSWREFGQLIGITRYEIAVSHTALVEAMARHLQ